MIMMRCIAQTTITVFKEVQGLSVQGKICKQKHVFTLHCFGHSSSMSDRNSINIAPNDTQ